MPLKVLSMTSESLIHLQSKYSVQKYWAWKHQQVSWGFLPDYCSLQSPRLGFWFSTTEQQIWQAPGKLAAGRAIGAGLLTLQQRAGPRMTESRICGGRNLKHWLGFWLCSWRLNALGTQAHAAEAIGNCSYSAESSSTLSLLSKRAKATQTSQLQRSDACRSSDSFKKGAPPWIVWKEKRPVRNFVSEMLASRKPISSDGTVQAVFFHNGTLLKKASWHILHWLYLLNDFMVCAKSSIL